MVTVFRKRKDQKGMPIFIYEPDAFEKLCESEGPGYKENQENFGDCSFAAFLAEWEKTWKPHYEYFKNKKNASRDFVRVNGNGMIYGLGGWNRYIVDMLGEILFHIDFAEAEKYTEKARKVGFTIFGEEDS